MPTLFAQNVPNHTNFDDISINYTTVSGTTAQSIDILNAPSSDTCYRIYSIEVTNAGSAGLYTSFYGTTFSGVLGTVTGANDSKVRNYKGMAIDIVKGEKFGICVETVPGGNWTVTVGYAAKEAY